MRKIKKLPKTKKCTTNIINALIVELVKIQEECADAIQFLVMHRLVYKSLYETSKIMGLDFRAAIKADMDRKIQTLKKIE